MFGCYGDVCKVLTEEGYLPTGGHLDSCFIAMDTTGYQGFHTAVPIRERRGGEEGGERKCVI